jgi:hypothetical protein
MPFTRWIPTFLAFPLGGLVAAGTVGPLDGPLSAAAGGLVVGVAVGAAQGLALRGRGLARRWALRTAAATTAGATLAALLTGTGTGTADLVATGVVTGAVVGAAQAGLLGRGRGPRVAFAALTAAGWGLGWLVSAAVIGEHVDERFHVFGSSGALVATVLTGLALRRLLPPVVSTPAVAAPAAAVV